MQKKKHRKEVGTQSKNFNLKQQESGFLPWMPVSLGFLIVIYGLQYRTHGKKKRTTGSL